MSYIPSYRANLTTLECKIKIDFASHEQRAFRKVFLGFFDRDTHSTVSVVRKMQVLAKFKFEARL